MNRLLNSIRVATFLLAGPGIAAAESFDQTHAAYARVLDQFVSDSRVDYAGLKADPADLDQYLQSIAAIPSSEFETWTEEEQLALFLNLYNAQTMKLIIEEYPLKSIRDIGVLPLAAWRIHNVRFGGNIMTLSYLENKVIRVDYDEPRIHFALVCAANGCPPLRPEPYVAARLDAQLQEQTLMFMAESEKNRFDAETRTLWLSPIFKWYKEDFTNPAGSLEKYVEPFLPDASAEALQAAGKVRVKYSDYDWSLNDWKR
jgi:hypothetical protein